MTGLTLWLVRHARPIVEAGVCYGRSDVAADAAHTQASAQALAEALRASPAAPRLAWASPRQRTQALLRALQGIQPMAERTDERLAEMDFGTWEGQAWTAIPPAAYDAWTLDFAHHRVGGGESVALLMSRVQQAWHDTVRTARSRGENSALWLTHAGVIRAMQLLHTGIALPIQASDWPRQAPGFGEWTVLQWPAPSVPS